MITIKCDFVGLDLTSMVPLNYHIIRSLVYIAWDLHFSKENRVLLSLGQILMQTILAAIFFEFFGRYFSF